MPLEKPDFHEKVLNGTDGYEWIKAWFTDEFKWLLKTVADNFEKWGPELLQKSKDFLVSLKDKTLDEILAQCVNGSCMTYSLQVVLGDLGCFGNKDKFIDGIYGRDTKAAVRKFQTAAGISHDGRAGPETLQKLAGVISGSIKIDFTAPPPVVEKKNKKEKKEEHPNDTPEEKLAREAAEKAGKKFKTKKEALADGDLKWPDANGKYVPKDEYNWVDKNDALNCAVEKIVTPAPAPKPTPALAPAPKPAPKKNISKKESAEIKNMIFLKDDGSLVDGVDNIFDGKKLGSVSSMLTEAFRQIAASKVSAIAKQENMQALINVAYDKTKSNSNDPNAGVVSEEAKKIREVNMAAALGEVKTQFDVAAQALTKKDSKLIDAALIAVGNMQYDNDNGAIRQEIAKYRNWLSNQLEEAAFDGTWIWVENKKLLMDAVGKYSFNSYWYNTGLDLKARKVNGLDFVCSDIYETIRIANLLNNLRNVAVWKKTSARTFEADNGGIQIADGILLGAGKDTNLLTESTIKKLYPTLTSLANRQKIVDIMQSQENAPFKAMDINTFKAKLPAWIFLRNNNDYQRNNHSFNQYNIDKLSRVMEKLKTQYPNQSFEKVVISDTNAFWNVQNNATPPKTYYGIDMTADEDKIFVRLKGANNLK
jgi:peptidoglycan hydrolase-like protein with peptidoglycan-binding domain